MEITVKIGDHEVVFEQETKTDDVYGAYSYAFKFDETCVGWDKDREWSMIFLKMQQDYLNDVLRAQGYLFLNDVYAALGVARTKLGQLVGWVYNKNNPVGDNYVDFDIFNEQNEGKNVFILNPNVDGFILDKI